MRGLRTTVVGSYPAPGWLEHAIADLDAFGPDDVAELQEDAVVAALADQVRAGVDVVTDGEQSRVDFNLSFYGFLDGISREAAPPRRFGPPAHDQRGRHEITGELAAAGLGVVDEWERLRRLAPSDIARKVSIPGPYTLAGRLVPNDRYPDRWAIAEALLPIVRAEIEALAGHDGPSQITIDEPSMSCYAWREDTERLVDLFNRTVEPARGRCRVGTHLCFGNFKGHPVGKRSYAVMFPDFLDLAVDELHLEMANREFAELEVIEPIAASGKDVAVGVVDVKSYYIETAEDVAERARWCLRHVPAERLLLAPDCGLSQTARWAARRKLTALVEGAARALADDGAADRGTEAAGSPR